MSRAELVQRYWFAIRAAAKRLVGVEWEDLAQATAARILARNGGAALQHDTNPEGYCVSETYRQFFEETRKASREKHGGHLQWVPLHENDGAELPPAQDHSIAAREAAQYLSRHPAGANVLRFVLQGMTFREIAKLEGRTAKAVEVEAYRTRREAEELFYF